jgi:hypothetical protein
MRVLPFRLASFAIAAWAIALGGCQGNLGSGSGLQIPAAPPYGQPTGPAGTSTQSRQRSLDGAVYLTADMATLPLPSLNGFALTLALGTPAPSPSPSPTASATPAPSSRSTRRRTKTRAISVTATPSPVSSESATPTSAAPLPSPGTASASPAPRASGSPSATPVVASPGLPPSPKGGSTAAKTVTKLVVYPEDAPSAPTPQPSGNVQTYPNRKALVRGFIRPGADVALYGLGAVKFTIPAEEDTAQRGYTVAVFTAGRRHHDSLVVSDPKASAAAHVVASAAVDGLVLKKNTSYLLVLYADELAATPAPVASGYPSSGNNPFVTPVPGSVPGTTSSGAPGGYVGPPNSPTATPTYPH